METKPALNFKQIIDLLATDKSRYRPVIVNYLSRRDIMICIENETIESNATKSQWYLQNSGSELVFSFQLFFL